MQDLSSPCGWLAAVGWTRESLQSINVPLPHSRPRNSWVMLAWNQHGFVKIYLRQGILPLIVSKPNLFNSMDRFLSRKTSFLINILFRIVLF